MTATHEGQKRAAAASSEKLNERGGPYSAFRGTTNARTDRTVPTFPAANDRFWLEGKTTRKPGDTPGFFVPKLATETFSTET